MSRPRLADNPYYVEYETLLKQLHALIADGKGDSTEADAVRDQMERPEAELSREERARLDGLSADLYVLQGDEVYEPADVRMSPQQVSQDLKAAWENQDWERALALFRHGTPFFPPAHVAYLRARAYEELGHLDTAYLFLQHATRLDPSSVTYKLLLTELLFKMKRFGEALEQADAYIRDPKSAPGLLVEAGNVLYRSARHLPDREANAVYSRVIDVLRRAVGKEAESVVSHVVQTSAHVTLALCYEALGQHAEARASYDKALQIDPDSDPALVGRGLLLLGADLAGAISDFERAVANNTTMLAPYLHLAQHSLTHGDYTRCVALCQKIMTMTQNPRTLAVVVQWIAISQFELREPDAVVQANFQAAVNLDPLNERIRKNYDRFEELAKMGPAVERRGTTWEHNEPIAEAKIKPVHANRAPAAMAVA